MGYAHWLTLLRIFFAPIFPALYLGYAVFGLSMAQAALISIVILALCEFSDVLDGWIARSRNEVTDVGKLLDPLADSLMHLSLFFAFTQGPVQLPLWAVLIFLYRELIIGALRSFCALRGVALAARSLGKIKTALQASTSFVILILLFCAEKGAVSIEILREVGFWGTVLTACYTAGSAVDYIWANYHHLRRSLK